MADILGFNIPIDFKSEEAATGGVGALLGDVTLWITIIMAVMIGVMIWYGWWYFRVFKFKIIVYENVAGLGYRQTTTDRARLIKFGDTGEEVLYLRKKKAYRSAYGRKMGNNTYWFAIGQDGYWYNIILGDLDAKMGMLDIEPTDRDMRAFYVAMGRNVRDRYRRKTQEKVVAIAVGGLIVMTLIMVIGGWYILDKIGEINSGATKNIDSTTKLVDAQERILSSLDNILNQGQGGAIQVAG